MAEGQSQSTGVTETQVINEEAEQPQVLQLKLRKPKKQEGGEMDNRHSRQ